MYFIAIYKTSSNVRKLLFLFLISVCTMSFSKRF